MKKNLLKKGTSLLLVTTMVVATALTGCGSKKSGTSGTASGNNLSVCLASEPETIDPAKNTAVDGGTYIAHAFEGLMKLNSDNKIVEGTAEKVSVSDDNLVYTFTIRDNAKWSDGSEVTADDFVYSWQRLVDPATASDYCYMIDMVKNANEIMAGEKDKSELGVKAVDSKTFEVTLTTPTTYFLEVCAFPSTYPVKKDIVEADPDGWSTDPSTYIGNGAYVLKEWTHQSELVFEKNKNYYDYANLGPDTITFKLMDDANSMLASYESGEILFSDDLPTAEIQRMKDNGLYITPQYGTYFICLNNEEEIFKDPKVRRALALAIDRNSIVNDVAKGGQIPADSYVSEGLTDADGTTQFHDNATKWYSVDEKDYQANIEEAKKLLKEAGYPDGKGFPTVDFMVNSGAGHEEIAEAVTSMWKEELGINSTISTQDWAVFIDTRKNGDYQIARHGWLADYNDPISFLDMWVTGGGNNDAKYSNKEYDKLIEQIKSTSDQEERMKLMHQAEDILGEDMPIIPIYFYTDLYLKSDKLDGFYMSPLGFKFFMYTKVTE